MTIWTVIAFFILGICAGMIWEREKRLRIRAKWLDALEKSQVDIDPTEPTETEKEQSEARRLDLEFEEARADLLREREEQARDEAGWPEDK